ncbi:hypothetical protein OXYTRIMIC_705 [Oxytricha trifallax]|uniref:Uncharacterized protein n=1 Tax=Oxytricha trifallax TaxID=1172189 RepID=A0A073HXF5_9SPIT|nr:hypothetical protein OXYTRIMIC_705 [Oxytricha trifallax]
MPPKSNKRREEPTPRQKKLTIYLKEAHDLFDEMIREDDDFLEQLGDEFFTPKFDAKSVKNIIKERIISQN